MITDPLTRPWTIQEIKKPKIIRYLNRIKAFRSVFALKKFQRREILEFLAANDFEKLKNYSKTLIIKQTWTTK